MGLDLWVECPSMLPRFIDIENYTDGAFCVVLGMYNDGVGPLYAQDVADINGLAKAE